MALIGALAAVMLSFEQDKTVDLTLVLPERARIEVQTELSERIDSGEWVVKRRDYVVEVTPFGDIGYRAAYRVPDAPDIDMMVFETDEALVPVRLLNTEEVITMMSETEDSPDGKPLASDLDMIGFLRNLSPEALTSLLAKDLILVAFGQGVTLPPGERNAYEQPSAAFGDAAPVIMSAAFTLESVDVAAGRAVVLWDSILPSHEAQKALPRLLAGLLSAIPGAEAGADKVAAAIAGSHMDMQTRCRYDIHIDTGLAETAVCTTVQEITVAGEQRRRESRLVGRQTLLN